MTAERGAEPSRLIVGRIRRAHGVRGEVQVEVLTESPEVVFAAGARLLLGDARGNAGHSPRELTVAAVRSVQDGILASLEGVTNRNDAATLGGRYLLVPTAEVQPPRADQVFEHDLIGLTVVSEGVSVGKVVGLFHAPSGLLLEISQARETVLMPYRAEFVRSIDLGVGRMEVDVPPGMFGD